MVQLSIDDASGNLLEHSMTNWKKVVDKIKTSQLNQNLILIRALHTIKYKLEFALLHMSILDHAYTLSPIPPKTLLKRSMVENIIFNLTSTLDALAHEINQIYVFNVDFKKVQIDHQSNQKGCLRCMLDNIANDRLSIYLNSELPRTNAIPISHWYGTFQLYRNQIMHRIIYELMLEPGMDYLPDDPAVLTSTGKITFDAHGSPIIPNYTHRRELRTYSKFCFNKVFQISEKIQSLLELKIP
jgi:hypothetical protein